MRNQEQIRHSALIIEGDPSSRTILGSSFDAAGIDPIYARNSAEMWRQLANAPDVVILDLCQKDKMGLDLLRQIRLKSDIPVVIHSSDSSDIDRIIGIEMGADDYLPKPCNLRELIARTRRLIKRTQCFPRQDNDHRKLHFGQWTLDTLSQELSGTDGQRKLLSRYPFEILSAFLANPFEPLSRVFLSDVLKRSHQPCDRVVDVHISNMRRLLGKQADGSSFIKSWRSQGYMFVAEVEAEQCTSSRH